jgi:Ca2+-binding RTX toxin-like protein
VPFGYLVSLGDTSLDSGDTISGGYTPFTVDQTLGSGNWTWSGWAGGYYYTDAVETGTYSLGTDGNVYFNPDAGQVDTISSASATNPPSYSTSPPDGIVDGTASDDYISATHTDAEGDSMNDGVGGGASGNGDTVLAGAGNDTVLSGVGDDSLSGGAGNDSLYGEDGNDTLEGGVGADYLNGGTGLDYADYSNSADPVNINLATGTASGGDATGDTYSGIDGVIGTDGNDTIIGFDNESTGAGDTYSNDFFGGDGDDYLDGAGGGDTLHGDGGNDTLLGGAGDDSLFGGDGDDSMLGGSENDWLEGNAGHDTMFGGTGSDTMSGGAGKDQIEVAQGDTAYGGDDQDTFTIVELGETGNADIFIDGNEGGTDWDTLDLGGLVDRSTLDVTTTADGTMSGTATLFDGSALTFSNIEKIICFVAGSRISTAAGAIPVEELVQGDLVLTRDNGFQPVRWVGKTTVPAMGDWAPICITAGTLGTSRDLLVSPQHRMLLTGATTRMLFDTNEVLSAAHHLVNDHSIRRQPGGMVTYIHLLLDQHEIIYAENCPTESFFPGDQALEALGPPALFSLFDCMPELRGHPQGFGPTARHCLTRPETLALMATAPATLAAPLAPTPG